MLRFERASTGLPGLDKVLDQLRLGDNVVWQVDSIYDYRQFVVPFVKNAVQEKRRVIYMRFGEHPPLLEKDPDIKVYHLNPHLGFEAFTTEVHSIATQEGWGAYYVFDSLSDLLSAWATDLMIGNFFRVTCPYLFELNTIAYFAVLRDRNSYQTVARIRDTTQLMLDLYQHEGRFYMHPLKVWNRFSSTMFLPHVGLGDDFIPITSSGEAARLVSRFERQKTSDSSRKLDYWDLVFMKAEELIKRMDTHPASQEQISELTEQLCRMMIGREDRVLQLAWRYFALKDLLRIRNHLIGTGFIGGKAVGMLLARAVIRQSPTIDWKQLIEPHDSFFVGSDVYYTYLVENECWNLRLEQKQPEQYFSAAMELKKKISQGQLPEAVREEIKQMLEYFGQAPIIVRSSSLLEDGFGNAFAGKYDSIFVVNQGSLQERYEMFENAMKMVYASTMNEDALAYRLQRGLASSDEQMALLVQRVSGSSRGSYFFPDLAGVALSHNPYAWNEELDPRAGLMRLVLGLGTRAVDRVDDDYPRVVALDRPSLRPDSTLEEVRRFSQHKVDLLNIEKNGMETVPLKDVARLMQQESRQWNLFAARDNEASRRLKELGYADADVWDLTFEDLLKNTQFPALIKDIIKELETAYEYPVDVEFTANYLADGQLQINLLQCRPLQTIKSSGSRQLSADIDSDSILFSIRGSFMGSEITIDPERLIYVKPDRYIKLSESDKYQVARLIGNLNRLPDNLQKPTMLIGPGRWGTSTPSLGVPVSFADICKALVLVEVASPEDGFMPELSFGTHFFQDLVEAGMVYAAVFPGKEGVVSNLSMLDGFENHLLRLIPDQDKWRDIVKVVELDNIHEKLLIDLDWDRRELTCGFHRQFVPQCETAIR